MKTRRELFSASTVLGSLLLVLSMTTGAQAQTLYRCGNSYQDKPCDKGQKEQILGKLATTDNTNKPVVDASCRLRGEDAKKIIWMREAGATQERVLSEAGSDERKKLINEIYAQRGNAADVRAAVEKECMDEKQRAMNAAKPAAPATPTSASAPATNEKAASASAPDNGEAARKKAMCDKVREALVSLRQAGNAGNADKDLKGMGCDR